MPSSLGNTWTWRRRRSKLARFWLVVVGITSASWSAVVYADVAPSISYVIEPFETNVVYYPVVVLEPPPEVVSNSQLFSGSADRLFGKNALVVHLSETSKHAEIIESSPSEGVVNNSNNNSIFGVGVSDNNSTTTTATTYTAKTLVQFGYNLGWGEAAYHCLGATHLSLWYKMVFPNADQSDETDDNNITISDMASVSLSMLMGYEANPNQTIDTNRMSRSEKLPLQSSTGNDEWRELIIPLGDPAMWQHNNATITNEDDFNKNLNRIRQWIIQLETTVEVNGDDVDTLSSNATELESWLRMQQLPDIMLDNLACVGDGALLGAAFRHDNFQDATDRRAWYSNYFASAAAEAGTEVELNGEDRYGLDIQYAVEMKESWGGFIAFQHVAPANAYFNLSQADDLGFSYQVSQEASEENRVHLRFLLWDASACFTGCSVDDNNEVYYSFHHILDEQAAVANPRHVRLPLQGDDDPTSPFYRPDWGGLVEDNILDREVIKGYIFEFSVNSQGTVGDLITGGVRLFDLEARLSDSSSDSNNDTDTASVAAMVLDPDIQFFTTPTSFKVAEFKGPQCADACANDDECLYAFRHSVGDPEHCYMASRLTTENIGFVSTTTVLPASTFWKDDAVVRGDFCSLCECNQSLRMIDCRGRNLAVLPKNFTPAEGEQWTPLILDLQNNPNLVYIGSRALSAQTWALGLEEVRLPETLVYIAQDNILPLSSLKTLVTSDSVNVGGINGHRIGSNFIVNEGDLFGHVCCGRGAQTENSHIEFCDMDADFIGDDSVYFPFVRYADASYISIIQQNSPFLSEAARSAQKCAEACTITTGCLHFSYDSREISSTPSCQLIKNFVEEEYVCCDPDDYSDDALVVPGWVSGRTAKARHEIDNAKAILSSTQLVLDSSNGYQAKYEVSLGADPLRGAVWIEPIVATMPLASVTFTPRRVALYDANMTATITVSVSGAASKETIVVSNNVQSCDSAFMSFGSIEDSSIPIFINVSADESSRMSVTIWIIVGAVLTGVVMALAIGSYTIVEWRRRRNDNAWRVKLRELHFGDPPEVLGRGTFGLVLLADYRGTKVAVKRVIPGEEETKNERAMTHSHSEIPTMMSGSADSLSKYFASSPGIDSADWESRMGSRFGTSPRWFSSNVFRNDRSKLESEFMSEMRLLSKLRHPCITTVMGAMLQRGQEPMLVMEYMEYGSLYDLLHNDSFFLEGEILLSIIRDISQGMRFLHTATPRVIHGDLKSHNILVDKQFRAKVADFGLSQKKRLGAVGTPYWMAPELLRGECRNSTATDVYSFGMVLYEVYSRDDPYRGEDTREVLMLVGDPSVNKRPPVPRCIPPEAKAIMIECFSGDWDIRPSFEEIDDRVKSMTAEDLEPVVSNVLERPTRTESEESTCEVEQHPSGTRAGAVKAPLVVEPKFSECSSILVADLVGCAELESQLTPDVFLSLKHRLFSELKFLADQYGVFCVETKGTTFMGLTNLMSAQPDHAARIARFAAEAISVANSVPIETSESSEIGFASLRIGIHSGPAMANIVGTNSSNYSIFGDTVNAAYQFKLNSYANRILCSSHFVRQLDECPFQAEGITTLSRGPIEMKGSEGLPAFWVTTKQPA